ncbi:ENPP6 [Cordylochernes scorpioides]|uniref:glycerophosphocholine cholinephosphodiesterase n=1 Tax=Cordylochernes scorpioides TaxID=51811 RepID=A0ABY6KWZ2_9ARAC|nr:ENPP6 [Cordylochernes scorpioides]
MVTVAVLALWVAAASAQVAPQRLVVVLVDGVRHDYVDDTMPGLTRLARAGARASYVTPVFPANSYPNWYSIATGDKISPKERIEKNSSKEFSMEFQRNADPPARETHASPAAARDDVTAPLIAASCSASTANPAPLIWGDSELAEMDDNDAFTVVRTKKRRRDSPVLPAMAAQSNSAGASRRQRSSTGGIPPVQEIRTTTAHVMEARARQASCTEEQCLFLEYCPDYQSYQYLRAIERVVGGPKNIFQFSKINGHYLLGLASKSLAEHLVREGLEIEGTLIRTFPFRKSSTRITVGNLPFFVADAAIIDALSRYGRITSIAPKLLKAGEFTYTDGRREAFILLHDGITIDKLPTRFEIRIKGEAWPAFLSHGIKCSKCHGQGHRRANCPQLHGRSTTARRASPPPSTDLPPSTAPGLPRQSSAAPPAPAPPSPSNKASRAPSDSCAASLPSAAPWPSTPAPPASPMQAVTPAPPPMTPSPEDPMGPRSAASRPEPKPPARPDFTTPCGPLPAQGTLGPATLTSDVDMATTEETSASSPAAVISTLPLPAPRPAEPMLPTTYREELTPPLMTPPPAPRLAGPIPPVPHGDTTTPAMTTPPPPLSMDRRWKMAGELIHGLSREIDLEHTFQSQVDIDDIVRAVLYPGDREPFIKRLPTRDRYILGGFISTAIWRARDADPSMLESLYSESHGIVQNYMYDAEKEDLFLTAMHNNASHSHWWEDAEPIWVTAERGGAKTAMFWWDGCQVPIRGSRPALCKEYQNYWVWGAVNHDTRQAFLQALDLFEKTDYALAMVYYEAVDAIGHFKGPDSKERKQALKDIDGILNFFQDEVEKRAMENQVNLMVVSDHGMVATSPDTVRPINIEKALDLDDIHLMLDRGPLAMLLPKPGKIDKVYQDLMAASFKGLQVIKKEDIPEKFHFKNHRLVLPILLLADEGYYINAISDHTKMKPFVERIFKGTHGYDPTVCESMRTVFYARGPAFKSGVVSDSPLEMVDHYNMMARILGLEPKSNNGSWDRVRSMMNEEVLRLAAEERARSQARNKRRRKGGRRKPSRRNAGDILQPVALVFAMILGATILHI